MITRILSLFKKPNLEDAKLEQRIERYVSPRRKSVNCSIHNAIHSKLAKELREGHGG